MSEQTPTETAGLQEPVVERQVFGESEQEDNTPVAETIEKPVNYLEKYKDKGWSKKIVNEKGELDIDKALTQIDNLEGLVGKKVIAFDWKNATDEQIGEYWKQVGVKDHKEYDVEGVPEFNQEKVQKMLHDAKIPPKLAKDLVQKYLSFEQGTVAELYSEKGFKESLVSNLGEDFKPKADAVVNNLRSILTPEEMTYIEQSVPNATVGILYKAIHSIIDKYGVKETGLSANTSSGFGVESIADIENKMVASKAKIQAMKTSMSTTPESYKAELNKFVKLNEQYSKAKERK